jgi:hypothetical protein
MTNIEKRLKMLENRARRDTDRWQSLSGEIKAFSAILTAMGAPICAAAPVQARAIIQNLKTYEKAARTQNEHAQMIVRIRYVREFFENRLKAGGDDSTSEENGVPRRKK